MVSCFIACLILIQTYTYYSNVVRVENALGSTLGLGVDQSVNRATQLQVGHAMTDIFGQVSRRLLPTTKIILRMGGRARSVRIVKIVKTPNHHHLKHKMRYIHFLFAKMDVVISF